MSGRIHDQQEAHFQSIGHRSVINSAGVLFLEAAEGEGGTCVYLQPREALVHAEFLLNRREQLEQLQKELDRTWNSIAQEVMAHFEEEAPGSVAEVTVQDIQGILEYWSEMRDRTACAQVQSQAGC